MRLLIVALVLACVPLLLAARCGPVRPTPDPIDSPDGGGGASDCAAMCATLERLGCAEEWGIDPEDGDCTTWCKRIESDWDSITMCPRWVAQAESCEDADRLSQCGD